jgi:hypothetical protein
VRRLALTVLVLLGEIFLDEVFEAGFAEVGMTTVALAEVVGHGFIGKEK